jgi:hypothetical protein
MKKLLLCSLLIILLAVPLVSAKDILIISNKTALGIGTTCGELGEINKPFCEKLASMGYDITTIDGLSVKNNVEETWQSAQASSDLLFLGQVSSDTLTQEYCDVLKYSSKAVFATANSLYCAISLGIISEVPENNTIAQHKVYITESHYATKSYEVDKEYENFYTEDHDITVFSSGGLIGVYGNINGNIKTYPALEINNNSIFWGFHNPRNFSDMAWNIFERSIQFIMDDKQDEITIITIPSKITKDETFLVYANIENQDTSTQGKVYYDSEESSLLFDDETNQWKAQAEIADNTSLQVQIETINKNTSIVPGNITITITSGDFNENYTITAVVKSFDQYIDSTVSYRLLYPNLTQYKSGKLEKDDNIYEKDITINYNSSDLILEVTTEKSGDVGGNYKKISYNAPRGPEYTIDPEIIYITTRKNQSITKNIRMGSGFGNLTGIKIIKSGDVASEIKIVTKDMAAYLKPQTYTSFDIIINTTDFKIGKHTGEIKIKADEHTFIIPIELNKINTTGSWLSINPRVWRVDVLMDKEQTGTFTLTNKATYPSTDVEITLKGTIHNLVTLLSQPDYIEGRGGKGEIKLLVDAKDIGSGEYTGTVELESGVGQETIITIINIIDEDEYTEEEFEERIDEISGKVKTSDQRDLLENIISNFKDAKDKWEAEEYSEALEILSVVDNNLTALEVELEGSFALPTDLISIVIVLVVVAFGIYFLYKYKDKIFKGKKSKKEKRRSFLPSEENYRTEYY